MLLLLLLFVIGIYFYSTGDLQRVLGNVNAHDNKDLGAEARKSLDMRYASGEITSEEYTKIKNLL